MSEVVARVIELFDSTCVKQFESMRCAIHPLNALDVKSIDSSVCASIRCHSDDIALVLLVSADKRFLANTIPMVGGVRLETASFQNDWCLELANRFLGRLKNKLLSHGCSLKMGLPTLNSLSAQVELITESTVSRCFQIEGEQEGGQIQCALSVTLLNNDMALDDYEDEDEDWFEESELDHL